MRYLMGSGRTRLNIIIDEDPEKNYREDLRVKLYAYLYSFFPIDVTLELL